MRRIYKLSVSLIAVVLYIFKFIRIYLLTKNSETYVEWLISSLGAMMMGSDENCLSKTERQTESQSH